MAGVTLHPTPLSPVANAPSRRQDPRQTLAPALLAEAAHNGFPVVATSRRGQDRVGLLGGLALVLMLGGLTFTLLQHRPAPIGTRTMAPSPARPVPEVVTSPTAATPAPPGATVPPPTAAQDAVLARPPAAADMTVRLGNAPVMVYDTSLVDPAGSLHAQAGSAGPATGVSQVPGLTENEAFGLRVGNGGVDTATASRLADPTNTVTQGTVLPAVLETAIDSDLPGYVRAVVSQDVRSFDGKRVLIPRSTRLIGQYKSGLAAGQTRAYVMWTRLLRPDGVTVALASPAIEFDGKSGLSGEVDQHFFRRFGSASMLSVLGGLGALASSGAGLIISAGGSGAAAAAAQRDAQIPPTVRVPQGQPIRVFIARDLDFSPVAP